jgi:hypothetical protein
MTGPGPYDATTRATTPHEYLVAMRDVIHDFDRKAASWLGPATVSSLRHAFRLTEREAEAALAAFLEGA